MEISIDLGGARNQHGRQSMTESNPKTIVITGVTRGIGRALVDAFIGAGQTVLGCGRSPEIIRELRERYPEPHDFYELDVAIDDGVKSWASLILSRRGAPDLLINNAAIINKCMPLWEVEDEEFSRIIDINIKGVANVIRHFVPAMVKRRAGVIVNLSSGWGRSVDAEVAPYCATKWAIEGLTKALAEELPSSMAAIPLSPGCVNTEMLQSCFGHSASSCADPETWAKKAVPFLLQLDAADNGKSLTCAA